MIYQFKSTKIFIGGIQGSGKTHLAKSKIIPAFNHVIVYAVHPIDFQDVQHADTKVLIPNDYSMETLDKTSKTIKEMAKKGACDLFILDEADLFLPQDKRTLQKYTNFYDILINHRHYNLATVLISRRPQSLPAEAVEQCEFLFVFAIEGANVFERLKNIDKRYTELLPLLSKDRHNFIFKRIGSPPELFSDAKIINSPLDNTESIEVKGGNEKKNGNSGFIR